MIGIFSYNFSLRNITLPNNTETVICGDSHTQSAINDNILNNSINISQSSEHYLYTYAVLKLTLKNNPNIKRIILGVSFHSFGKAYDKYIYGEKSKYMYPKYLSIVDIETFLDLYSKNSNELLVQMPSFVKNIIKSMVYSNYIQYPFYGSYYKSSRSNLNDSTVNAAIQRHYYNQNSTTIQENSVIQNKYLNKIVKLCNNSQVELVLINTPISKEYKNKIPKKIISHYNKIIKSLKNQVVFYDFSNLSLDKKQYGDGDHLNYLGAEILSKILNKNEYQQVRTHNNVYKKLPK